MPQNYSAPIPNLPTASGTAYTASTTITDISPTPVITIPANQLTLGSKWKITGHGVMSPAAATTLIMGIYYGGTGGVTAAVTAAITPGALTTLPWTLEAFLDVRAIGASGSAMTQGEFRYAATTLTTVGVFLSNGAAPAAQTIDTTTAKVLSLGATWGTNNASTIQCHQWWVEAIV